jgi:hypothetical protein
MVEDACNEKRNRQYHATEARRRIRPEVQKLQTADFDY